MMIVIINYLCSLRCYMVFKIWVLVGHFPRFGTDWFPVDLENFIPIYLPQVWSVLIAEWRMGSRMTLLDWSDLQIAGTTEHGLDKEQGSHYLCRRNMSAPLLLHTVSCCVLCPLRSWPISRLSKEVMGRPESFKMNDHLLSFSYKRLI